MRRRQRDALVVAAVGVAYFLAHQLAFLYPDARHVLMALWPAGGIGLASLLLVPRRLWPAIVITMFVAGNAANVIEGRPFLASLGFMTANAAESLGCAAVIVALCGDRVRFEKVREVLALIVGVTLVNAATACIGAGTGALVFGTGFAGDWQTWFVANGLGILLVTPLLVTWAEKAWLPVNFRWGRVAEYGAFAAVWCGVTWLTFRAAGATHLDELQPYLLFAFLPWVAFRFGPRGTAFALLLVAALSVTDSAVRVGPSILGGATLPERLLAVQVFLAVLGAAGLLLAASFAETLRAGRDASDGHDRLRALGDNIPEGMVYQLVREPDGTMHFAYVSSGVERVLGVTAAEVQTDPAAFFARIHGDDLERFRTARETPEGVLRPVHDVFRFHHPDGQARWIQISSAPRQLADGRRQWDGAAIDITERKQTEQALAESHRILEDVQEMAHLGGWEIDLDTRTLVASPEAHRVYGIPGDVMRLEAVQGVVLPEYRPMLDAALAALLADGAPYSVEFKIRRPSDGAVRHIHSVAAHDAAHRRVTGFIQDITDRKQAEEENSALQARLFQSQRIETVGRLAGGVAHDFNNAVQTILLNTEMALVHSAEGTPLRRYLADIRTSAQHSAGLTAQLLTFARKQTAQPRVLDLNTVIAAMLPLLQRLIGEDVATVWAPGAGLWRVRADPTQVDQILTNLAVNARDAVLGVGRLALATANVTVDAGLAAAHPDLAPGDFVRLTVADDGCGMDAETLAHIFEPFFTTKPVGAGTGLGLATVHGIVSQNGGAVTVESTPGGGSTFAIWLPRVEAPEVQPLAPPDAVAPRGGTETILLVEDAVALLRAAGAILSSFGYTVLAASRPGAALRTAEEHEGPIHLLITDVVMPEMNGRVLANRLAAIRPALKRLYISGYADEATGPRGIIEAEAPFLAKPFTADALARKVRAVLDGG